MLEENWVLDVTMDTGNGLPLAFCPVDTDGNVMVGLTLVTDRPPGRVVGVFSEDGQEAVEGWCAAHPAVLADLGLGV